MTGQPAQSGQQEKTVTIGGACGYWGDSAMATPQFLAADAPPEFIVYDYLAEITLSIMARARAKDPEQGYARDFVSTVLHENLPAIAQKGVRIVSNAGGVNPRACGRVVQDLINAAGLDLKVAVVTGDDLMDRLPAIAEQAPVEMFSGAEFPPSDKILSINAYIGARAIADALDAGADIVITGRCVDSAVTLGVCLHRFGWAADDWDRLSAGTLAGHIIECGPQATGGNFTDWREVADGLADIGYPIAEIAADGSCEISKPDGTGGKVSIGTVGEQMLYEIGDPQAYVVPDVVCDFSEVRLQQVAPDGVRLSGARGFPAPGDLKVSMTWADGFRGGMLRSFYGQDSAGRARVFCDAALKRATTRLRQANLGPFSETSVEILGADSQFGGRPENSDAREVTVKLAARHPDAAAISILLKEATGVGLAAPPGLSGFQAGRATPSPVVRLYSFLIPRDEVPVEVSIANQTFPSTPVVSPPFDPALIVRPTPPDAGPANAASGATAPELVPLPLIRLAWARSGDKGDKANIGILARNADFMPFIWAALSEDVVAQVFDHFLSGPVERFYLPGPGAMNILLHDVLGGGGIASLRNDPQGKGYAQLLLNHPIPVPDAIARVL